MPTNNVNANARFHLILFGASGYTGRLVAKYIASRYGYDGDFRWALGGRNMAKLEKIRVWLGSATANIPLVKADSRDSASLEELAKQTSVICSTVGPYARYGSELVATCVRQGTHYCDLSGEIHWMRRMIDLHQRHAQKSGARVIHACGFDSIPSDMGVYFLQKKAQNIHGNTCKHIKFRLKNAKGSFSGGTVASLLETLKAAENDGTIRKILNDSYSLNSSNFRPVPWFTGPGFPERLSIAYDSEFNAWTTPFVMAPINTRVVRRSHELMKTLYGEEFHYDEAVLMGRGLSGCVKAIAAVAKQHIFSQLMAHMPTRFLAQRFILPKPGDGPSEQEREQGFFEILFLGKLRDGRLLRTRIKVDQDPGYSATAKMLAESAVCLVKDDLLIGGGFWTPSSAMGDALLNRLQLNAGMRYEFLGEGFSTKID